MILNKLIYKSSISLILMIFLGASCLAQEPLTPKDALEIKESSKVLYNTNNKKEALELLLKLPKNNQDEETYLLISNIYSEMGNYKSAINYLNKVIVLNKNTYKAYYNLGVIYQKKKDTESAIENYKKAISKKRDFAYAYYNLGCVYLDLKDYKRAKSNFVRAIYYKNDEKDFYYNLAYCYKMLGNEKSANKILDTYNKFD